MVMLRPQLFGERPPNRTSCPKPLQRLPSEMVVRDRIREYTVHNLAIESLVREISANNERAIRNVGGGRLPDLACSSKRALSHPRGGPTRGGPVLPNRSIVVGPKRVDSDLGPFDSRFEIKVWPSSIARCSPEVDRVPLHPPR
jgi:hypothetical protein